MDSFTTNQNTEQLSDEERKVQFCSSCGTNLDEKAKFCPYCGKKLEAKTSLPVTKENPLLAFWNKRSLYGKVVTVSLTAFVLLALISFLANKTATVIIAILQIALVVVSILMHKSVIKLEKKKTWLKYLLLGVAILFTALNIMSYSWGTKAPSASQTPSSESEATDNHLNPALDTLNSTTPSTKIASPISSEDAANKELAELIKLFEDAGFVNLVTESVKDIDPESSQEAFRNDISIGNDTSFVSTDTFPLDAEVKIVTHIPYEKYKVTLRINFISNLLFNKYGVELSRGYTELGTLSHGEDGDFEMWLTPGKHTLTFTRVNYTRPTKEIEIDVKGETEISYNLSCYEDSIHIEKTAHIDMGAIGENEAAVPAANSGFKHKDCKAVEAQLTEAGFTNISTFVLYDIVFGWTQEGEVDSVKINGKTDYIVGDVFAKDTPIVITYHMSEEENPSKPVEVESTESEPTETIPSESSPTETVGAPDDWMNLLEKHYEEVEKQFKDAGFTNITCVAHEIDYDENNTFEGSVVNIAVGENGEICIFDKDEQWVKDVKIRIDYRVKPAKPNSEYEKAFIRDMLNYDLYYMFDTDANTVVYFGTNDTYIENGSYTGDFSTGVTITWSHGEWTDTFIHRSDNSATLIDGSGWDWEYKACDVEKAQKILDGLK